MWSPKLRPRVGTCSGCGLFLQIHFCTMKTCGKPFCIYCLPKHAREHDTEIKIHKAALKEAGGAGGLNG